MPARKIAHLIPLFEKYTLTDLAERTGYSEFYLARLKTNSKQINYTFRYRMSKILGLPEQELFAPEAEG